MEEIYSEFPEPFYAQGSDKLDKLSQLSGRAYWVVLNNDAVIGTVGIAMIANDNAVLKSMMLHKDHRGKGKRLSERMLAFAENKARKAHAVRMYLGTMVQMKGAQRFYEKNGYALITEGKLPIDFPANPVDKIFYWKML